MATFLFRPFARVFLACAIFVLSIVPTSASDPGLAAEQSQTDVVVLPLQMVPEQIAFSHSGNYLATYESRVLSVNPLEVEGRIAVVDVSAQELIGTIRTDGLVPQIWINDQSVCYQDAPTKELILHRFETLDRERRYPIDGRIARVDSIDEARLRLRVFASHVQDYELNCETEDIAQLDYSNTGYSLDHFSWNSRQRLSGGFESIDGRLYKPDAHEVSCFVGDNLPFPVVELQARRNGNEETASKWIAPIQDAPSLSWGRASRGRFLIDYRNRPIEGSRKEPNFQLSADHPVGVDLRDGSTGPLELVFHDLVDGSILGTQVIDASRPSANGSSGQHDFAIHENALSIVARGNCYFTEVDERLIRDAKVPLHISYPATGLIDLRQTNQLEWRAAGGSDDKVFTLLDETNGIQIDPQTGVMTIDGPLVTKNHLSLIRTKRRSNRNAEQSAPWLQHVSSEIFERLVGYELPENTIGCCLPIALRVTDSKGRQDVREVSLVAVMPQAPIDRLRQSFANGEAYPELEELLELASLGEGSAITRTSSANEMAAENDSPEESGQELANELNGEWTLRYTNGVTRVYLIEDGEHVQWNDGISATIEREGNKFLFRHKSTNIERVTLADGELFVEYYLHGQGVENRTPSIMAIGTRSDND